MAIQITLTNSPIQKIVGIPTYVIASTNVPATIFYTLDGTTPTLSSTVYVDRIDMPGNKAQVELSVIAYDGVDVTPPVTELYGIIRQGNHFLATANYLMNLDEITPFPYSSDSMKANPTVQYGEIGLEPVNDPELGQIPDGYDGTGTGSYADYTNKPIDDYLIIYSETDRIGQTGRGIGTIPTTITVVVDNSNSPPLTSDANSATFNPKAFVVYQDNTKEPYDGYHQQVNRTYFFMENFGKVRDGAMLGTSDTQPPTGSALVPRYDPISNTLGYYYFDARTCKWVITKQNFVHEDKNPFGLKPMVFGRSGATPWKVYQWDLFRGRVLS